MAAIHHLFNELGWGKVLDYLASIHAKSSKRSETRFQSAVINLFWVELKFDPLIYTNVHHLLDIAGTRTKRQAIERMDSAFVLIHLRQRWSRLFVARGQSH